MCRPLVSLHAELPGERYNACKALIGGWEEGRAHFKMCWRRLTSPLMGTWLLFSSSVWQLCRTSRRRPMTSCFSLLCARAPPGLPVLSGVRCRKRHMVLNSAHQPNLSLTNCSRHASHGDK